MLFDNFVTFVKHHKVLLEVCQAHTQKYGHYSFLPEF